MNSIKRERPKPSANADVLVVPYRETEKRGKIISKNKLICGEF